MINLRSKSQVASRGVLLLCLAGLASPLLAQGARSILTEPRTPLLPQSFSNWQLQQTASSCLGCFHPEGQVADVLKEDGLDRAEKLTYRREKGSGTLDITAFQFGDATGAVSAFTYLRKPGSRTVVAGSRKIGSEMAESGGDELIFRSGVTVVIADAGAAGPSAAADLHRLETMLPKVSGPRGVSPLLPTLLPAKGLEIDTVRYALGPIGYSAMGGILPGNVVGFDKSAEVIMAKYEGRGTLTLLLYPTPQIAGNHGRAIAAELNRQGASVGTVKLRREGPLLAMTTGAWSAAAAQQMVEGIHLHDELTWNKTPPPEFRTELRKTVSLLTSILILSGLLALAAIVLGLFFGFGRAAIRVLQGKPAATEPEFLRIDLSGQAEKIHLDGPGPSPEG